MQITVEVILEQGSSTVVLDGDGIDLSDVYPGCWFTRRGSNVIYTIASIPIQGTDGGYEMQLSAPYAGKTESNALAVIHKDFDARGLPIFASGDTEIEALLNRALQVISSALISSVAQLSGASHILHDAESLAIEGVDNRIAGKVAGPAQNLFSVRNDALSSYTRSTEGLMNDVDLSAISVWNSGGDSRQTVTLIAPDIGIGANHFHPANGTTVRFVTPDNAVVNLIVQASQQIGSTDTRVIKFASDAPETIKPATLVRSIAPLIKAPVFFTDQDQKVFIGIIQTAAADIQLTQAALPSPRNQFWKLSVIGDSSHPAFMVLGEEIALLFTLYSTPASGPNLAAQAAAITAAMAALGSGHRVTFSSYLAAGSAAHVNARFEPSPGEIPVVGNDGKLSPTVLPASGSFGTQPARSYFGVHSDSAGAPSFQQLTHRDIPLTALHVNRLTVSDANWENDPETDLLLSIVGALDYTTLTASRTVDLTTADIAAARIGALLDVGDASGACSGGVTITINYLNAQNNAASVVLNAPFARAQFRKLQDARWILIGRTP